MTETRSSPSSDAGANEMAAPETVAKPEPAAAPPSELRPTTTPSEGAPAARPVLPWVLLAVVLAGEVIFHGGPYLGLFEAAPDPSVARLTKSVATIEGRIAALERTGGEAASKAQLTQLGDRLTALEKSAAAAPGVSPELVRDLAAIKGASEAIADRVRGLEERTAKPTLPPEAAARLNAAEAADKVAADQRASLVHRLEGVDQALRGHEASMAALTAEDRRFSHELARLQEGLAMLTAGERAAAEGASGVGRMQALLFGLAELRDRLRAGGPFAAELETIKAVAGDDKTVTEAIAKLTPAAAKGLATVESLRSRFEPVAAEMARADWVDGEGAWWSDALHRLSSLVTVRRTGPDVPGTSAEAVAARAEWRLRQGDLAGAVAAFEGLQGAGAKVAAAWVAEARARLAADETLAGITRYALKQAAANP